MAITEDQAPLSQETESVSLFFRRRETHAGRKFCCLNCALLGWDGWPLVGEPCRRCVLNPKVNDAGQPLPAVQTIFERIFDEGGRLLVEQPYPFKRLFASGQKQVINSVPMTVLSCVKENNIITTTVRLHQPWPNAEVQASAKKG